MEYPRRSNDSYEEIVVDIPPRWGDAIRIAGSRSERRKVDWVWGGWSAGEWTPNVSAVDNVNSPPAVSTYRAPSSPFSEQTESRA